MSDEHATPDEVLEQEIAGGAVAGEVPHAVVPTLAQGVTIVREAPALRHNTGSIPLAVGGTPFVLGREPRRRRLLLSVTTTGGAVVIAGDSREQAAAGYGLIIPAGQLVELHTADALYLAATGAGSATVSWLGELDNG